MNYAKLENGILEYVPTNYTTPSGSLIVNFNKNVSLMKRYGFKEVVDIKPSYDEITEYLTISGYTENDESIIVNYTIKQMDLIDQEASIEEKIKDLKTVDSDHEIAISELYEIIMGGKSNG